MDTKPTPAPPSPPTPPIPPAVSSAAAALGRRAAGVPKQFTPEELERRRHQMGAINETRRVQIASGKLVRKQVASGKVRRATPGEVARFGR